MGYLFNPAHKYWGKLVTVKKDAQPDLGETRPDLFTGESPVESAHKTWAAVQKDLGYAIGPNVHRSWTGRLHITSADAFSVTLSAPTRFIATKIETNYMEPLVRLWKKHDMVAPPRAVRIAKPLEASDSQPTVISAVTASQNGQQQARPSKLPVQAMSAAATNAAKKPHAAHNEGGKRAPRKQFSFDNFIVGPSNELAFAVARQTANSEAAQYNPIVFHGANGMGKTHLMYAIKHSIETSQPGRRVRLITGEQFVTTFVNSLRGTGREAIDAFKASLRGVDLLMIDDAHFIATKPNSQEELLHTLVSLVGDGRQVMIATDRHPDQMEKASDRLKSYLCSGLICKIGAADYELRKRILDRLITRRSESGGHITIPQNARDHLAARINATPRDLEGAFNQVVAQSEFLGTPITLETIQDTLSDSRYIAGQRLTVDRIQRAVAEEFDITLNDMVSKRRTRIVARPRQVAMYLCKKMTKRSLPDIGRRFGGRDHTTVMHAVKRIEDLRQDDPQFHAKIQTLESNLKAA